MKHDGCLLDDWAWLDDLLSFTIHKSGQARDSDMESNRMKVWGIYESDGEVFP